MYLFAVGKCVKRGTWILSIYQRVGDRYPTVKLRRTEAPSREDGLNGLEAVTEDKEIV